MPQYTFTEYRGRNLIRDVWIETGTQAGGSVEQALRLSFQRLYSIECNPHWCALARRRFAAHPHDPRVTILHGSSPALLPAIIDPERPTTFWLDAHYTGGLNFVDSPAGPIPAYEMAPSWGQCPLLAELRAIFAFRWRHPPYVLIDDAVMFGPWKPDFPDCFIREQWPLLADIARQLPENYTCEVVDNVVWCMPRP